ncbi:hypothetical protein [uncultured Mediterranean phage uvDeep1-CGR2-KM23-C896]|nr:hypothetical protein [uncultured Mediterranean phage uvDeep1-CGR2-KM23-C896]
MSSLIRNRKKVRQVIDFTGVQNGKMHPSDIDAVLEFDNDILILIEVKYKFKKIPTGQRLLLERICDSWHTKKSIVLKVEHDYESDEENIPLENCKVTAIYYDKKWIYYSEQYDFKHYINKLGEKWECKKCKF